MKGPGCNSIFSFFLFLCLFSLSPKTEGFAGENGISLFLESEQSGYVLNADAGVFERDDFLNAIDNGMRSEITYVLRQYRETRGIFSFLGDTLIEEERITLEAGWDRFQGTYVLSYPGGERESFSSGESLADRFFSLTDYAVSFDSPREEGTYIKGRAEFIVTKLIPPMNIISFFLRGNRRVTPWERVECKE